MLYTYVDAVVDVVAALDWEAILCCPEAFGMSPAPDP